MPKFSTTERERLTALVDAVRQIEEASIVAEGRLLSMRGAISPTGEVEQEYTVFDSEPFRSLAMSVRLIYMNDEPANFASICNVLHKAGEKDLRDAVTDLRKAYNTFLNGPTIRFSLHGDFEGTTLGPRELFEAWLYGGTFHQDPKRKAMYAELVKFGPRFTFGLHVVVTQIVQFFIHLGFIVSTALAEEQRLHGSSALEQPGR